MHCIGDSIDVDSYLEAIAFPIPPEQAAVIFSVGYDLVKILNSARAPRAANVSCPEIHEIIALTERVIAENRNLIFELSPPVLKEAGLHFALEELAKNILAPTGIHWQITAKCNTENLEANDSVCVILYRSGRELLINAVKHSGASEVSIIINCNTTLSQSL